MKNLVKSVIRRGLINLKNSKKFSDVFEIDPEHIRKEFYEGGWTTLEPLFTQCRHNLYNNEFWRYGPLRVKVGADYFFKAISPFTTTLKNKTYLDLGCGMYHPLGMSAFLYINGVQETLALDQAKIKSSQRAAEALCDLLIECLIDPQSWQYFDTTSQELVSRIQQFDLKALREGNLKAGLRDIPIEHKISDINQLSDSENKFDLISSTAVLEHFLDFESAINLLFSIMSEGGLAYHRIDLRDHRAYEDPSKYHYWSFLDKPEEWSDGLCNRLRSCEWQHYFQKSGFEILSYEVFGDGMMPQGFREKIQGRFAQMSDEELNITRVACLLRKPHVS